MNTDKILAEAIAKDYVPKDNSKIIALKKLDSKAKLPATVFTYAFGIVSTLIVGLGMCLAMQVLGSGALTMAVGIVIGVIGLAFTLVNYPLHKKMMDSRKKKYSRKILELSEKIMSK